jgi:hypothetical protein
VFYLISGNGYPNYLNIIENAIEDVNNLKNFDFLIVAVDSEDKTYQEKYNRAVRKHQFPNSLGNGFNIKTAEFAAILRQIRQTCERTGRLSNKSNEIKEVIDNKLIHAESRIIIQHFCLETWALGNRIACRKNTTDVMLLEYKRVHDVRNDDPELLPP